MNPPLKALLAREPKEDEPVDMIDGDNFEEEDSQVKGLSEMGFDSPGDSVLGGTSKGFSQGQSVDGIPNGIMENGQGNQEVPTTVNQSQHASGSARIVADGGEEIFPEAATVPGVHRFVDSSEVEITCSHRSNSVRFITMTDHKC